MAYLLHDGYVVTMDDARTTWASGFVLTEGGRILATGPMSACPNAPSARRIDCAGMIVLPGLIDAMHLPASHLVPGMALPEEVFAALDADAHRLAARLAGQALASTGATTALLPMPRGLTAAAVRDCIAALSDHGVRGVAAVDAAIAPDVPGALVRVEVDILAMADGRASETTICRDHALARANGRRLFARLVPENADADAMRSARANLGRSAIYTLMELGVLDEEWLLVCPEEIDDTDRALILEAGCHLVGLPVADGLRGTGSTAFSALARAGASCALGSEGVGIGWTTDMIEQMKAVVMIQNTLLLDPTAMSTERALEMATIDAARALGLSGEIGSIEPGKQADITVVDMRDPHLQVASKPLSTFIACARTNEVAHVLAGGKLIAKARPEDEDLRQASAIRRSLAASHGAKSRAFRTAG